MYVVPRPWYFSDGRWHGAARPDATLAELRDALPTNGGAVTSRPHGAAGGTRSRFMTRAAMGSSASRASRPICCAGSRSPRGVRLRDYTPCGRWQTHTIIAALRVEGLQAPAVFDGPLDNPTFMAYVEQNQAQLFEEDEPAARAEWLAEFRKDFESYISREEGTESSDGPRRRPVRRRGEGATKRTGQRAAQG